MSPAVPIEAVLGLSDAELEEVLAMVRERRRIARQRGEQEARAIADELAELVSRGDSPALGLWRKHGRPGVDVAEWIAEDEDRIAACARNVGRFASTISLRAALAALADDLLARGANPEQVERAFASVVELRRAA